MFIAVVAVGLGIAWFLDRGQVPVAEVGGAAPRFTVDLIGGGSFDLDHHLAEDGRPLILNLWASWCTPCRTEMPEISAFAASHPDIAVLGVAVEDALDDATAFADDVSPGYPVGFGDDRFRASYPSIGLPATYLIDSEGQITGFINGIVDSSDLETLSG